MRTALRPIRWTLLALALAGGLTACGKKKPPAPPEAKAAEPAAAPASAAPDGVAPVEADDDAADTDASKGKGPGADPDEGGE